MAIVAVSTAPTGIGTSLSKYVAEAVRVAENDPRVKTSLSPMFSILEGSLEDCLDVAKLMHEELFKQGAERVGTLIKIDDRRDKETSMEGKMKSVTDKLG